MAINVDSYLWYVIANDPRLAQPYIPRPMIVPEQLFQIGEVFSFAGGVVEIVATNVWCTGELWGYARAYRLHWTNCAECRETTVFQDQLQQLADGSVTFNQDRPKYATMRRRSPCEVADIDRIDT